MAKTIQLDIVTPERLLYSADVNMVVARAIDGDIGILPGHAPLITALAIAPLRIKKDDSEQVISLCGGFMEVQPEKVTILAACAELPDDIDVSRAKSAKARAEQRLKENSEELDVARAEAALRRALVRLKVAEAAKHKTQ